MKLNTEKIKNVGQLKKSGWKSRSIRDELRENLINAIREKRPLFEDIKGYDKTVLPQLQNAILAKHDIILLGLRGQAKTRLIRSLPSLLDEYMPVLEGTDLNENPLEPISLQGKKIIEENGDKAPIRWISRDERFAEKLATPDTTVADLIGDIDPIKAATKKLVLADPEVINFGIIPRTNRGIFAINELPDLQPRIQVALLNIMQERDIQIRGFKIRIPLDVLMIYSANPEDYTNRGNIITPLKDRIDSQIITHYPQDLETGIAITGQEAWVNRNGSPVDVPHVIREIVEQIAFEARKSEYIDQKSGVSVRMTITALEQVVSSAERRTYFTGEKKFEFRVCDLFHTVPALTGKLELVYEGEQEGAISVARHLVGKAIDTIFLKYFPNPSNRKSEEQPYKEIVNWFAAGNKLEVSDTMETKAYQKALKKVDGLEELVQKYTRPQKKEELCLMMDIVLEALHQHSILGREDLDEHVSYSDMVGSMLGSLGSRDDYDFREG